MHSPLHRAPPPHPPPAGRLLYRRPYAGVPQSVSEARCDLEQAAVSAGLDHDLIESAVLCLSELASNAVEHAEDGHPNPRYMVCVEIRGERMPLLHVAVHDSMGSLRPAFPSGDDAESFLSGLSPEALSGRGLAMVAMLSHRAGVDLVPGTGGKAVWCDLLLQTAVEQQHAG